MHLELLDQLAQPVRLESREKLARQAQQARLEPQVLLDQPEQLEVQGQLEPREWLDQPELQVPPE